MDYKDITFLEIVDQEDAVDSTWSEQLEQDIVFRLPNNAQLLVRWMSVKDVKEVHLLEQETFPSPWHLESFLFKLYERNYNLSIIGRINEKLITYAISYVVHDELHFSNIAVNEHYRRCKIGEIMLWLSMQLGKERGCRVVHLEVRKNNAPAIKLYEKFGFNVVGIRKNYYINEHQDALLMSRMIS